MSRTSTKKYEFEDSLARLLNDTQSTCTAVVKFRDKYLVASNVDGRSKSYAEERCIVFSNIFSHIKEYSSERVGDRENIAYILRNIHLKDYKSDLFEREINTISAYISDEEKVILSNFLILLQKLEQYIKIIGPINSSFIFPKGTKLIKTDSTFEELREFFREDNIGKLKGKKVPDTLTGFYNADDRTIQLPELEKDFNINEFIDNWVSVGTIIREKLNIASSRLAPDTIKNLNIFSRPVIDVIKILQSIDLDKTLLDYEFEFVHGKDNSHAEMQILDRIFGDIKPRDEIYIGISKLCCGGCAVVIENFDKIIPHVTIKVKGHHYKPYSNWTLPEFLRLFPDVMSVLFSEFVKISSQYSDSKTGVYEYADLSGDESGSGLLGSTDTSGGGGGEVGDL